IGSLPRSGFGSSARAGNDPRTSTETATKRRMTRAPVLLARSLMIEQKLLGVDHRPENVLISLALGLGRTAVPRQVALQVTHFSVAGQARIKGEVKLPDLRRLGTRVGRQLAGPRTFLRQLLLDLR